MKDMNLPLQPLLIDILPCSGCFTTPRGNFALPHQVPRHRHAGRRQRRGRRRRRPRQFHVVVVVRLHRLDDLPDVFGPRTRLPLLLLIDLLSDPPPFPRLRSRHGTTRLPFLPTLKPAINSHKKLGYDYYD